MVQIYFSLLSLPSSRNLLLLLVNLSDLERFVLSSSSNEMALVCNPSGIADFELNTSVSITSPLIQIIQQRTKFSAAVLSDQRQAKVDVVSTAPGFSSIGSYVFASCS